MSPRKELVIVNISGLIGILISMFILPPRNPVWAWACMSAVVLFLFNYVVLTHKPKLGGGDKKSSGLQVLGVLGVIFLLGEIVWRLIH